MALGGAIQQAALLRKRRAREVREREKINPIEGGGRGKSIPMINLPSSRK